MNRELKFLYDEGADLLYVSLGHPEYTDYTEVNDDLILRLDPETKEIVGFTIIDFLAHFSRPKPRLHIPLAASFQPLMDVKELITA
ncbi:MAG: DUF2283 domain-containing protein [Chloroflexi bacterium]|nr:DUF2283 domain-containing protein [Chloroflexota bacterium]